MCSIFRPFIIFILIKTCLFLTCSKLNYMYRHSRNSKLWTPFVWLGRSLTYKPSVVRAFENINIHVASFGIIHIFNTWNRSRKLREVSILSSVYYSLLFFTGTRSLRKTNGVYTGNSLSCPSLTRRLYWPSVSPFVLEEHVLHS